MEQPKATAVIKVIMSPKLDKNMLFSVLLSPEYGSILFLLKKLIAAENWLCSQFPALEEGKQI